MESKGKPNRLVHAKSPYLRQHAYNPVDWYEWGEEAFARARAENKPIFLSIGYSTCHWCHNMARESFEAEDVAAVLNEHYISIKVDREERPDIDHAYMKVCQALTGQGGWPLTIIMTPEKIPFFAGTYFPRERKYHLPGIKSILEGISRVWQEKREMLEEKGQELIETLQQWERGDAAGEGEIAADVLEKGVRALQQSYDREYGGFGAAPKFPIPHSLTFLLRAWKRRGDEEILQMVVQSLKKMRQGGIFDQLGYGFHRYSVDQRWLVPHFEKMLYDQALLAQAYVEAYQVTGEPLFADTAHAVFTYVLGEMQDKGGAFYSAENAESEGVEGKYYTWRYAEIMELLGEKEGSLICDYFGVIPEGNMEGGQNVLHLPADEGEFRKKHGLSSKEWAYLLEESRKLLLKARSRRVRPSRDDKILTSWNGLMIGALARGGAALRAEIYLKEARRAADFILATMQRNDLLYHRYMEGDVAVPGFLEDYAFFCAGLLDLFTALQDPFFLEETWRLHQKMEELFWDSERGGFFYVPHGMAELPLSGKDAYDGAVPSGNSVAAQNLLRLAAITGDETMEEKAKMIFRSFGRLVSASPHGFTAMLSAYDFARGPRQEVVIAAADDDLLGRKMLEKVQGMFLPHSVLLYTGDGGEREERLRALCPSLQDKVVLQGKATAYVCRNYSCQAPVNSVEELVRQLTINS